MAHVLPDWKKQQNKKSFSRKSCSINHGSLYFFIHQSKISEPSVDNHMDQMGSLQDQKLNALIELANLEPAT